jgi:hypothetical protein
MRDYVQVIGRAALLSFTACDSPSLLFQSPSPLLDPILSNAISQVCPPVLTVLVMHKVMLLSPYMCAALQHLLGKRISRLVSFSAELRLEPNLKSICKKFIGVLW